MKILSTLLFTAILSGSMYAQQVETEKQILLSKDEASLSPEGAMYVPSTGEVRVFFKPQKLKKEKGEKRKFERYQVYLNNNLETTHNEKVVVGSKEVVRPEYNLGFFQIGTKYWIDDDFEKPMSSVQFTKFDLDNNIISVLDVPLCEQQIYVDHKVLSYGDQFFVLVQYAGAYDSQANYLKLMSVSTDDLQVANENFISIEGMDKLSLESVLMLNEKIYMVGSDYKYETGTQYSLFKLNMDGREEARSAIVLPSGFTIGSIMIDECAGELVLAGEYGPPGLKTSSRYGSSSAFGTGIDRVKCGDGFEGLFVCRYSTDLKEKATKVHSYNLNVKNKLTAGNPEFLKQGYNYWLRDFIFLSDGSFYVTAELYQKYFITKKITISGKTSYSYETEYKYNDAVVFKFDNALSLNWVVQFDRLKTQKSYKGHLPNPKPLEPGYMDAYLLADNSLAVFFNTTSTSLAFNAACLSAIHIPLNGKANLPVDFSNEKECRKLNYQYEGIVKTGDNSFTFVGVDKKKDNLWIKKIAFTPIL